MQAIVVVDQKWGIGKNNDLLFSLKEDMKFFRQTTMGKIVVMGSNTLKSFPGGNPLKNRTNIVLYPGGEKREDCLVVESLDQLFEVLKNYDTEDIFVIGGANGLHSSVSLRANFKLSFSKMTFTHQIIRELLVEQIYRAFKILKNEPYHR